MTLYITKKLRLRNLPQNKIKYFSGEGMLIFQGAVSFDKWTGIFPDTKKTLSLIKKFMR